MPFSDSRRTELALRAVRRELRKPGSLLRTLRKSGSFTIPLLAAGPTLVVVAYGAAFALTPAGRADGDFYASAAQIIPVLLLVLAVEQQAFRWRLTGSSLSADRRAELLADERFQRFADGTGPVGDAVEALLDATVDAARTAAETLLRQLTALLLLAGMLVGEIGALVPLLGTDPGDGHARPVMAAIVAGFAGVAYIAITGSRFGADDD